MAKWKLCPFCGGGVKLIHQKPYELGWIICCRHCGANIKVRDIQQAKERWNRRVVDEKLTDVEPNE